MGAAEKEQSQSEIAKQKSTGSIASQKIMRWFERYTLHQWRKEFRKEGGKPAQLEAWIDARIARLKAELDAVLEREHPHHGKQLALFQMDGYMK